MTAEVMLSEADIFDAISLVVMAVERGGRCGEVRLCATCKEANRLGLVLSSLTRSYQRKTERQKSSRKLSRLAMDVERAEAELQDALSQRCLTPVGARRY